MGRRKKNIRDKLTDLMYNTSYAASFTLLLTCLKYMSCDDIKDMLRVNDLCLDDFKFPSSRELWHDEIK